MLIPTLRLKQWQPWTIRASKANSGTIRKYLSHVRNDMFKSPFLIPPIAPCGQLSFSLSLFSSASLRLQWSMLTAAGFRVTHTSCCRWAHLTCLAYWNHKYSEWGSKWITKGALLKAPPGRSMSDISLPLDIICNWTRLSSESGTYVRTLVRILLSDRPLLMLFNSPAWQSVPGVLLFGSWVCVLR